MAISVNEYRMYVVVISNIRYVGIIIYSHMIFMENDQ